MAIAQTVQKFMVQHDIDYDLMHHHLTGSSHETALAAHVPEDHIAKAVVLKDDGGYSMVVVPATNWVDMDHLRKELDRDFHLATEEEIARLFSDCDPGAVPPLGPAYGIETFLDDSLESLASIYFESGDHQELVHTMGEDFQEMMSGVRHGNFSSYH